MSDTVDRLERIRQAGGNSAYIEKLEHALQWYADPASYEVSGPLEGGAWGSAPRYILTDGGQKAREALGIEE